MNFQNIPRDDTVVKRAIVPQLECLVKWDYSQIEPRMLAYFMSKLGDDSLAALYRDGADVYRELAAGVYGKRPEDVTKDERNVTKRLFLSLMYGGGVRTVMEQGHDQKTAKRLIREFYKTLPGIRLVSNPPPRGEWGWDDYQPGAIEIRLKMRGYIETIEGRQLPCPPWGEHKMLNSLIQGSAADLLKHSLVRIHQHLKDNPHLQSRMVATVHDEVQMDCIERELPYLANAIPNLMVDPEVHAVVPVITEMEWTKTNLAEMKPWPEEVAA